MPTEFMTQRALAPDPRQDDRFMRQKLAVTKELYQQDLKGHYGCVNAIEFSNGEGDYIASGLKLAHKLSDQRYGYLLT